MNPIESIMSVIPIDTKIVNFNLSGDGTISNVEVKNISGIIENDMLAANILLATFLACFGIDIPSIARNNVQLADWRLTDMQNLLLNAKWEQTNVVRDGVTYSAMNYIKTFFQIYDKEEFVNTLFMNLIDTILNSDAYDDETLIISTDDETYQMIKLIAFCFGANADFTKVEVGEAEGMNIPFDPSNIRNVEETIYDILVEKGLIDSSISKASFALSSDIHHMFEDSPLNSDNFFKYFHFSYIQCPNGAWMACIYFTGEKVSTINFIGTFYNVWHGGSVVEALYTAIPIDMNGTPISDDNLMGTWQKIGPTQYAFAPNLNEYDVFSGAMESRGACFCKRTNCDLIVDGNTVHYAEVRYDSTQGNNHYINTSIPQHWWHMPYGCSGDASLQITSRYFVRSNKQSGDNVTWSTQGNPQYPWQGLPTTLPSEFTDDAVKHDVILNNVVLGEATYVPSPTIDDAVSNIITGSISNFDLLKNGGWIKFLLNLGKSIADGFSALLPTLHPFNTIDEVNSALVDLINGVDVKTGEPIEKIDANKSKEYTPFFNEYPNFRNNASGKLPTQIPGTQSYVFDNDNANNLSHELWQAGLFDGFYYGNITPVDCVQDAFILPFNLDYKQLGEKRNHIPIGNKNFGENVYGQQIMSGVSILTTSTILVGGKSDDSIKLKKYRNFLDYAPYTQASIYIPFVGERELDINLVMYRYLFIQYRVFNTTGDFVATVYTMNHKEGRTYNENINTLDSEHVNAYPVLICTGNMAYHIPVTGKEKKDTAQLISSAIQTMGGVIAKKPSSIINGAMGIMNFAQTDGGGSAITKGELSEATSFMSNWLPYVTLYSHETARGFKSSKKNLAYNATRGLRTERSIKIGNMGNGFHKVNGVRLEGLQATYSEREEILKILKDGFYISI